MHTESSQFIADLLATVSSAAMEAHWRIGSVEPHILNLSEPSDFTGHLWDVRIDGSEADRRRWRLIFGSLDLLSRFCFLSDGWRLRVKRCILVSYLIQQVCLYARHSSRLCVGVCATAMYWILPRASEKCKQVSGRTDMQTPHTHTQLCTSIVVSILIMHSLNLYCETRCTPSSSPL